MFVRPCPWCEIRVLAIQSVRIAFCWSEGPRLVTIVPRDPRSFPRAYRPHRTRQTFLKGCCLRYTALSPTGRTFTGLQTQGTPLPPTNLYGVRHSLESFFLANKCTTYIYIYMLPYYIYTYIYRQCHEPARSK